MRSAAFFEYIAPPIGSAGRLRRTSSGSEIAHVATWQQYSNGWRTSGDIECYSSCTTSGTLTDWSHVQSRFGQVASWQPYGGPGAFNDYDSLEVGNGSSTGLTDAEQQSQMSL